jgi:hypothetical protein
MRNIPFRYDELAQMLLDEVDAAIERRAADQRERELERMLEGRTVDVDGFACVLKVRGERVILSSAGPAEVRRSKLRPVALAAPEAEVVMAALGRVDPQAADLFDLVRRGRERVRLLCERDRLRDAIRELARKRHALERLREGEVRAAERLRRRLERRARLCGAPIPGRSVTSVIIDLGRALAAEARRLHDALLRCEAALAEAPPAHDPAGAAFLASLRALAPLFAERVALEYRRIDREMLRDFRRLTIGAAEVERRKPAEPRRFLKSLAFLMAKANFSVLAREDLERGFEIGPAPGVRLSAPLDRFEEAYFFVRGANLEPLARAGLVPRYEKFAYCLLDRPPLGRRGRRRARWRIVRRARAWFARRVRPYVLPRVDSVADYVRAIARSTPPEVAVDPPIAIKLFRDGGLGECGLVLPGAAIRYRLRDVFLVAAGAAGGVFSKIAEKPLGALLAPKLLLTLFAASIMRGLLGMRRSRMTLDKLREEYENRHLQATRMNAVDYFLREAAEMDAKEILLAYFFAVLQALDDGLSVAPGERLPVRPRGLAARIETFFRGRHRAAIDFDIEDALGGLEALGIAAQPIFLAPGENADYFDERLTGESFRRDAETLLSRPAARAAEKRERRALERALEHAAARDAAETARRDAGRPLRGCDPLTNAPRWWPLEGEEQEERPGLAKLPGEAALVGPAEALRRVRRELRARLGLEEAGAAPGTKAVEPAVLFGERFTL